MTETNDYNKDKLPRHEALGFKSIKEYQGWCYFNDVESTSYCSDLNSEEFDRLCAIYGIEDEEEIKTKKKKKKTTVKKGN